MTHQHDAGSSQKVTEANITGQDHSPVAPCGKAVFMHLNCVFRQGADRMTCCNALHAGCVPLSDTISEYNPAACVYSLAQVLPP